MDKSRLVAELVAELRRRYDRALAAVSGAHEAATGADTKAENKYDTRGLEASYLAAGQAEQADELLRALLAVESFDFRRFGIGDPVDLGAFVETEQEDEFRCYLLAPAGGGVILTEEGGDPVTVLGPASPLARNLIGLQTGSMPENSNLLIIGVF